MTEEVDMNSGALALVSCTLLLCYHTPFQNRIKEVFNVLCNSIMENI